MIYNLKQLGEGFKTVDGKVLKANSILRAAYIEPTPDNKQFLETLLIDEIFDFRSQFEIESKPNFASLVVKEYPLGKKMNEQQMKDNAIKFQAPDMVKFYGLGFDNCVYLQSAVRDIVLNPKNVLFHCTAGKDRTGVYGIILMNLLGYSKEDINAHYLQIDPLLIEKLRSDIKAYMKDVPDEMIEDLIIVKQAYFDAFYDYVINKYESFDNYRVEFLGLSDAEVENFKAYYLQ